MRYVFLISFDGTHFSGSQRQPQCRTVQSVLEDAAQKVFGIPVKVTFSGRTDAGVHAAGQVVHLDGETSIPAEKLREAFNRLLPEDLKVLESIAAPEGFDCTCSARRKTYCYRFYTAASTLPLLERYAVRVEGRVDLARMREAAALLVGEHDFTAFSASRGANARENPVKGLRKLSASRRGAEIKIVAEGSGFMYKMVRMLVGALVDAGTGRLSKSDIEKILASKKRGNYFQAAPARGLFLEKVFY